VRDSAWTEVHRGAERLAARALPPDVTGPGGVFVAELYPGERAAHVQGTLGDRGQVTLDVGAPPARDGFAVSDLQLGFPRPEGFVPNPGYAHTKISGLSVRFEVYGAYRDPVGLGYLRLKLSIVPEASERTGLAGAFLGPRPKPYVASELEEVVARTTHERVIAIDPERLEPGPYRVVVEVTDTLRQRTITRTASFMLSGRS
jgi:hypothetical protein